MTRLTDVYFTAKDSRTSDRGRDSFNGLLQRRRDAQRLGAIETVDATQLLITTSKERLGGFIGGSTVLQCPDEQHDVTAPLLRYTNMNWHQTAQAMRRCGIEIPDYPQVENLYFVFPGLGVDVLVKEPRFEGRVWQRPVVRGECEVIYSQES